MDFQAADYRPASITLDTKEHVLMFDSSCRPANYPLRSRREKHLLTVIIVIYQMCVYYNIINNNYVL